jgi:site-specific DNA recombinase
MDSHPKKPAVGYIRVSTEKQAAEGVGMEAQQGQIVSYAVAAGYELVDVLADEGISGSKSEDERPGLAEILTMVQEKRVSTVIVTKRDRLARTQALAGHIETRIQRAGGQLIVIDEAGVSDITRAVMTMVAEVERLLAIQRTRLALRTLKEKGIALGGIPFGFRRGQDGKLEAEPVEMSFVRRVHSMRKQGKTLREIATFLTQSGARTKKGGSWSQEHVRLILGRPDPAKA